MLHISSSGQNGNSLKKKGSSYISQIWEFPQKREVLTFPKNGNSLKKGKFLHLPPRASSECNCDCSVVGRTISRIALNAQPSPTAANHCHQHHHNQVGVWGGLIIGLKKQGKWHRTTVCKQLLPEIEKAQSVTPQTRGSREVWQKTTLFT